jgi:hypothetical protein
MTTEDLFILLFCTVDDWLREHGVPARPGPLPMCSDSELLTFALARELLGYDSERRFRRVLLADWRHLFPHVPAQSELNRRTRWLGGALELLRQHWLRDLPGMTDGWVAFDTTPLPVKQPSRVRHPDAWAGPEELHAGFGFCAAKALWFYGFRLATLGPLLDPVPWVWALVPAAVNERAVLQAMVEGAHDLRVLADKGLSSNALAAALREQRIVLLTPPTKAQRETMPTAVRAFIAAHRGRIESSYNVLKDQLHLEHHRAKTFYGLLTRIMGKLATYPLRAAWRYAGLTVE